MRSAKSELYILLNAIIKGGNYTDAVGIIHTYTAISGINHFAFWNNSINTSEHDNYPLPAVFFQLTNSLVTRNDNKILEASSRQTTKEECNFILHVITNKIETEDKAESYLDALDLAQTLIEALTNISVPNVKNILHVSDEFDSESQFMIDYPIQFRCNLVNIGVSSLANANDLLINPDAPVEFTIDVSKYNP